jgi:hypothetical protein
MCILLTTCICHVSGCETLGLSARVKPVSTVQIPFIKNSASECYYLDEFMPTPDSLVNGRSGKLNLRYYTYKAAHYKEWDSKYIILSFYSTDNLCWSLFEEYYMKE